jgi:two-component SAPR family response regulator
MQVLEMKVPQRMSEEHLKTLEMVARSADTSIPSCDASDLGEVPTDVQEVLEAVGMTTEDTHDLLFRRGNCEPQIIVHLFGYPLVRNKEGLTAEFRKKRALELLTWLSLNRDRARRSAARTAMWEIAINDSTFSTVVSDMRRGLSVLGSSMATDSLVPITYNDDIPLSVHVMSDADILADALHMFQQDESYADDLLNCLQWLRDVPFAGTSYSWADLDGSTTRLVILGVTAATEVARWAIEHQNTDALTSAVRAGLRVMPGNEELLELQRSALELFSH